MPSLLPVLSIGLTLDPLAPPLPLGADRFLFGPGVELDVLPAVVLHLDPDATPPREARPLGGRSWLVPAPDAETAVRRAVELDQQPGVMAFPDVRLAITRAQDPSEFDDPNRSGQWYLDRLEMDELLAVSLGSPDVRVAVIDSAIDIAHPDLEPAVLAPYDAYDDDDDPSPNPGEYCFDSDTDICDEHGTAVSGVILARADNGEGIVGMCPECTLVPIKMLGEDGGWSSLSADVRAFEHAIAQDVGVINNSWGYNEAITVPAVLAEVIGRATTETRQGKGALVVFAAGNDDREIGEDELQAVPGVLCVSAIDSYGYPTNYTNYGGPIDLAAPSATVSIVPGGGVTSSFGGTSAAAPVASGLAAWALSVEPELTAEELGELLISTAEPSPLVTHDDEGHNEYYGYGVLDALAVRDALVVEVVEPEDEPRACGCAQGVAGGRGAALLLSALLVLVVRRRQLA